MAGTGHSPFERLPDDLILSVAQWLDPRALLRFGACARRMHGLPKEALWRSLCTVRCEATPRFRLTPEREQWLLNHVQPDWVARYRFSLREIIRTTITTEELQTLNWHFNFTPAAGGRGRATLVRARFTKTHVVLPNYPPLPYMLHMPSEVEAAANEGEGSTSADESSGGGSESGGGGRTLRSLLASLVSRLHVMDGGRQMPTASPTPQCLQIANFPGHCVQRLEDGEWLVYNHNVSFVSCVGTEPSAFDQRGFLTVPSAEAGTHEMMEDEEDEDRLHGA